MKIEIEQNSLDYLVAMSKLADNFLNVVNCSCGGYKNQGYQFCTNDNCID